MPTVVLQNSCSETFCKIHTIIPAMESSVTLSWVMLKNGLTYFKNSAVWTPQGFESIFGHFSTFLHNQSKTYFALLWKFGKSTWKEEPGKSTWGWGFLIFNTEQILKSCYFVLIRKLHQLFQSLCMSYLKRLFI